MGNSEVGHLNIGSGRIVYQELTRITKAINDGEFFENESLKLGEYTIPDKLKQIHEYISENYFRKISLEDLADRFFISKVHLSRENKKIYGITLGNALTNLRLSHAKSMLRFSDDSVDTIALSCGFQDTGYFIKVFKKAENMTPLQYRKKW